MSFGKRFNYIVGQNGMGKTNLLDAIYFVAMGKSYHLSQDKLLIKHQENYFRIVSSLIEGEETIKYVSTLGLQRSKFIERNGVAYTQLADHIGRIPIVFIAPTDAYVLFTASQERRKFLDRTISQTNNSYLIDLMNYNKLLKQRNALLKKGTSKELHDLLDTYDRQMAPFANNIYHIRDEAIRFLLPMVDAHYREISQNSENVSISYKSHLKEHVFLELCHQNRQRDLALYRSSTGIHKDDIIVKIDGYDIKKFASQGQMKSFVLALKLAQHQFLYQKINKKPILLIDDIFAKLDKNRVKSLLSLLNAENFGQIFITDTSTERMISVMENLNTDFNCYQVKDGEITTWNE